MCANKSDFLLPRQLTIRALLGVSSDDAIFNFNLRGSKSVAMVTQTSNGYNVYDERRNYRKNYSQSNKFYNYVAICILLLKVQDDLQYLRAAANAGESSVDVKTLDMVLNRTEQGIQAIAERVVHSTHDQITSLPAVAPRGRSKDTSSINSHPHPHPRDHKKHRCNYY